MEFGDTSRESEFIILKERKLVPLLPVRKGMQRFSFLLETCQPGSVPDPHLLAATLDLVSMLMYQRIKLIKVYVCFKKRLNL